MPFESNITVGNISLDFTGNDALEWKFRKASSYFASTTQDKTGRSFKAHFRQILKDDLKHPKAPHYIRNILNSYLTSASNYKFLSPKSRKSLLHAVSFFGRSIEFSALIRETQKQEAGHVIFYPLTSRLLIIIDTANNIAWIYYVNFRYWKNRVPSVANCIYLLINLLAPYASSFQLHAAGLRINGKGYLFAGESGQGKSTLTSIVLRNNKKARIISDDQALVYYREDDDSYYAIRLPGDNRQIGIKRRIDSMKIDRIYLIEKSKVLFLDKIGKLSAFQEIASKHVRNTVTSSKAAISLSDILLKILSRFPVYRLKFQKNKSFLKLCC